MCWEGGRRNSGGRYPVALYGLFGVSSCAFFILAYLLFRDEVME
jgi:hypothetical protein